MKNPTETGVSKTMLIGDNWYYWHEGLKLWKPETYKFEETK